MSGGAEFDIQQSAIRDDRTAHGVQSVEIVRGNLVRRPFQLGRYKSETSGSGAANFQSAGIVYNPDGTGTAITIVVPSGITHGVRISLPFYGRVFGLRFRKDDATTSVAVMVDGVAYLPAKRHTVYTNASLTGITDAENLIPVVTDLEDDGPHYAEIVVTGDEAHTAADLVLLGYAVEERMGYRAPDPGLHVMATPADAPDVATVVLSQSTISNQARVRKVVYQNYSGGSITVTVYWNSVAMWTAIIATGAAAEFDTGGLLSVSSLLTHKASAATSVKFTVIGSTT